MLKTRDAHMQHDNNYLELHYRTA